MQFILPITILVAFVLLATNIEAKWQPTPGLTWSYLLGADEKTM